MIFLPQFGQKRLTGARFEDSTCIILLFPRYMKNCIWPTALIGVRNPVSQEDYLLHPNMNSHSKAGRVLVGNYANFINIIIIDLRISHSQPMINLINFGDDTFFKKVMTVFIVF